MGVKQESIISSPGNWVVLEELQNLKRKSAFGRKLHQQGENTVYTLSSQQEGSGLEVSF